MSEAAARVKAFDWLRGIAVLVMIETHALALLRPALHAGSFFVTLQWVDGLVAPAFIFAAGFSLSLTQVRAASGASASPAARRARFLRTLRRIGEVLLVATLVNWMWFPLLREPKWILRIDILQCIGLSLLVALPVLAGLAARPRLLRAVALGLAALAFGLAPLAEHVAGPLARLVNASDGSVFPLLPWGGYVFLGAAIGATAALESAGRTALWLAGLVAAGVLLWWATPLVTAAYPPHDFWVTSPCNHARRWTQTCLFALFLLGMEQRFGRALSGAAAVRFVEVFGTSSLAAYFFHQLLLFFRVFGFSFAAVWGDRLSWAGYWPVLALLIAATFALTVLTDRLYQRVLSRRS